MLKKVKIIISTSYLVQSVTYLDSLYLHLLYKSTLYLTRCIRYFTHKNNTFFSLTKISRNLFFFIEIKIFTPIYYKK